tara:strand:- start:334 stop:1338 length:1005 start_codon:yes stop_codon:yes gene_type:complete
MSRFSKKISPIIIFSLIFISCSEEPPKSEWDLLREYCETIHQEFSEKYNTQSKLEDAEILLYPNFKPFNDVLPLSVMGSAKLINTMINGGDCFTKFDWSGELEWKIDDYIIAGGSCEILIKYLNVNYLDYCQQDWNTYYSPSLPVFFKDGTLLDYETHFQEFKEDGNLDRYVMFLKLKSLDNELDKEIEELESTTSSTTATTTSSTTTTTTSSTTTTTTIKDNPPYWENNIIELIQLTYTQRNCFAYGTFKIPNFYDENPVSLFFDSEGVSGQLTTTSGLGKVYKNGDIWEINIPIGGPPGPTISIYAEDSIGQLSDVLTFKVPDDSYDCPYDD